MTLHTISAPRAPTKLSDHCDRQIRYVPYAILVVAAGTIFTLASAATNLIYGISKSPELPAQIVWGSVAVAASLALAVTPAALMRAAAIRSTTGVVFSLAALLLFGSFSLSGALGSAFGSRVTSHAVQTTKDGTRARLQRSYDAAQTELQATAPARPTAELEALLTKLKATSGANGCVGTPDGPISRKACGEAATLAIELGRSKRRAELEAQSKEATAALNKIEPPKFANADAIALSSFAEKIGIIVTPEALNPWLALLAVALVEFGGGTCFAVAGVFGAAQSIAPVTTASASYCGSRQEHVEQVESAEVASPPSPTEFTELSRRAECGTTPLPKLTIVDDDAERLVAMVEQHGNELLGSNRTFARALGVSHTQAGRLLDELEASGRVALSRGKGGTVVRLAKAA